MTYQEAKRRTDPAQYGTVVKGSTQEQAAIDRFSDFFASMSVASAHKKTKQVYADSAFFNDTLKSVQGAQAIEAYLAESLAATESVVVEIEDIAESGGNYYFIWTMTIRFKNLNKGRPARSSGMSHIRFNREGKIVLHQDYWDATVGLFEYMPVVGRMIRYIKGRI
jgi:limonene-1,2-epoxide hydrolase